MKKTLVIVMVIITAGVLLTACGSTRSPFGGGKRGCPCDNVK